MNDWAKTQRKEKKIDEESGSVSGNISTKHLGGYRISKLGKKI